MNLLQRILTALTEAYLQNDIAIHIYNGVKPGNTIVKLTRNGIHSVHVFSVEDTQRSINQIVKVMLAQL